MALSQSLGTKIEEILRKGRIELPRLTQADRTTVSAIAQMRVNSSRTPSNKGGQCPPYM
ncbi:MAG TPA: hypothetical protein V6D48_10275 [Oculatellaceae cyanobacterium]